MCAYTIFSSISFHYSVVRLLSFPMRRADGLLDAIESISL
jgi:hypothetical protein